MSGGFSFPASYSPTVVGAPAGTSGAMAAGTVTPNVKKVGAGMLGNENTAQSFVNGVTGMPSPLNPDLSSGYKESAPAPATPLSASPVAPKATPGMLAAPNLAWETDE